MFALALVPMIGMLGMAGEGSSWFMVQRAAQYTADQAALAAAANNCAPGASCATNGTTYGQEVAGVTQKYNFVDGENDTTVVADIPTAPAPCDTATCYRVTVERNVPFQLLRVVGFGGNATTAAGQPATNIHARAIAMRAKSDAMFCITTLSGRSDSFEVNGGPNLDLTSCTVYAPNGGASCTNQSGDMVQGAYVGTAGNSNDNCGSEQVNPLPVLDPYAARADSLTPTCSSYPRERKNPPLPASNIIGGSMSFSASTPLCGDIRLGADVTVTGNSVLVIENGHLDLAGHMLRTAAGASLTIVFTGTSGPYEHYVCSTGINPSSCTSGQNGGVLDFSAPTSGPWSGIAIYQDPRLPTGRPVDFVFSGSSPDFNVTGMIYAPRADVTVSGAINHATMGLACLTFFVNSVLVNGTASIFATPTVQCEQAGLNPDEVQTLQKVVLVG